MARFFTEISLLTGIRVFLHRRKKRRLPKTVNRFPAHRNRQLRPTPRKLRKLPYLK